MFLSVAGLSGYAQAASLDDLSKAMGADKIQSIEVTGSGYYYHLGGSGLSDEPWPKFNLKKYRQSINFKTESMDLSRTLTQFLNPPRGAGFQPIPKQLVRRNAISGGTGWGYSRGSVQSARSTSRSLHALWTSPIGLIKAARTAGAKVKTKMVGGISQSTLSIQKKGAFKATGYFDERNLLTMVYARVANPVYGDMQVVTTYGDYKNFSGVNYPSRMVVRNGGHLGLEVTVSDVKTNTPVNISPPKGLKPRKERVKVEKVADGVWYIRGGSHHSVAIEMADHVVVYEGPLSEGRGIAVINATRKTIPGKPIRYVVNSHHHFDHSGGLRAFAAKGITIVTHSSNKAFYEKAYANPNTVKPDALTKSGKKAKFRTIEDTGVLESGDRRIELFTLKGNVHCESNMIAYLPKEKILIVADAYSARRIYKKPAKEKHPARVHLWQTLVRLNLDIKTVLPIHGRKVGIQQIRFAAGEN